MKATIRRHASVLVTALLVLGAGSEALAQDPVQVTQAYCIPAGSTKVGGFKSTDDSVMGGKLSLNGNGAAIIDEAGNAFDGALRLTEAKNGQGSQVYYEDPVDFGYVNAAALTTRAFRLFYSFSVGPHASGAATGQGAGLAFVAQNAANQQFQTGANGGGMGYGGISTSWAIEIDTKSDIPPGGPTPFSDPVEDHIGFLTDGIVLDHRAIHSPKDVNNVAVVFGSPANKRYYMWIDYPGNGSRVMSVFFSEDKVKPAAPVTWIEQPPPSPLPAGKILDDYPLPSSFDTSYWLSVGAAMLAPQAWVGFTASNYANGNNAHHIHEWEFSNVAIPCACQGADACKTAPKTLACSAGADTQGTGVCVECTAADETPCSAEKPVCHPTQEVCVQCNVSPDCASATPVCDPATNQCEECLTDADCPSDEPVCNPGLKTCGPCTTNADCDGHPLLPLCVLTGQNTGECGECLTDADCPEAEPACNPSTNTCGTCTTDADCNGTPETPACASTGVNAGNCVPCTQDVHCPMDEPVCDPDANTCGECAVNADCPENEPICDPPTKTCGPCTSDADCAGTPETPLCALSGTNAGACVECVDAQDCAEPRPLCDTAMNVCGECITDADCPDDKPECNPFTKICDTGCTTDADCAGTPETPVCATIGTNTGSCVPCNQDSDCRADLPNCDEPTNTCTPGCTSDEDCSGNAPVCAVGTGVCGPCSEDGQCTRFEETPICRTEGDSAGQCTSELGDDVIEGGGCACRAAGSPANEGLLASAVGALGLATALARRRRRRVS